MVVLLLAQVGLNYYKVLFRPEAQISDGGENLGKIKVRHGWIWKCSATCEAGSI